MFVEHLADDAGMLFIYPEPQPVAIWMKNTPLSLDILFVRADGRVHRIAENATPQSTDTIPSNGKRAGGDRAQGRQRGAHEDTAGRAGHPSGVQLNSSKTASKSRAFCWRRRKGLGRFRPETRRPSAGTSS